ncbi:DNA-binding response regulator [Candidatus Falkowbacteria bacterium RBG_13_39_14]|uniref:DNA-binding response regulator n=1 Tax=Candidatus Falkowbacteria bacterium RBG_13_39_14 TaxID=1797985 RepID=A0A1F5S7R6_9BACT|nr:MAG: DNA-binding response regulator [Candidatus Falkowbacteria bacterium RBG_13_39_14]
MRVLLIEDDKTIVKFLKSNLEAECFTVDAVEDGARGSFLALTNEYDLIILDYVLPKMDGRKICSAIRGDGRDVPIIVLTVKTELETKVDALNLGADDYITKPFSFDELLARIRAVMRRPKKIEGEILQLGDLSLDIRSHKAKCCSKDIYLTRKEFAFLEYFMRNRGIVVSRGMIMEHVWDMNADPFSNTIESHVLNLRKKLESGCSRRFIHTVPGRGYKFE